MGCSGCQKGWHSTPSDRACHHLGHGTSHRGPLFSDWCLSWFCFWECRAHLHPWYISSCITAKWEQTTTWALQCTCNSMLVIPYTILWLSLYLRYSLLMSIYLLNFFISTSDTVFYALHSYFAANDCCLLYSTATSVLYYIIYKLLKKSYAYL